MWGYCPGAALIWYYTRSALTQLETQVSLHVDNEMTNYMLYLKAGALYCMCNIGI